METSLPDMDSLKRELTLVERQLGLIELSRASERRGNVWTIASQAREFRQLDQKARKLRWKIRKEEGRQ